VIIPSQSRDQQQEGQPTMVKSKTGPAMFEDLTDDEVTLLANKLISGAAAASYGRHDYDVSKDIQDITSDVQANYAHKRRGRQ
jgi:hypothetical protein